MKKLLLSLCLLSTMATAQNIQKVSLGISHSPSLIFEWGNINLEGSFFVGGKVLSLGVNAKTNSDFKESELSLLSKTRIFAPNEKIDGSFLAGAGFGLDQINEDVHGEKHREYFLLYGLQFSYQIVENWELYFNLQRHHSGINAPPIAGIGATIKL